MRLAVLVLMLLLTKPVCAQIYFQNPSFEDDSLTAPCYGCTPSYWFHCSGQGSTFDSTAEALFPFCLNYMYPSDGEFFVNLTTYDPAIFGDSQQSLFQAFACSLHANKSYSFSFDYITGLNNDGTFNGHSHLEVIGTNDTCQVGEVLFDQYDVDTAWHQMVVTFTPTQDWNIIWLRQKVPTNESYGALIDNFSPITCLNYNEVQSTTNDTSISIGNCITLNATALGAFDSAYWKTSSGTIVGNGLVGIQVCPTGFTEYVVCTRSTDCGQFWSYDTVRVEVPNGVPSTKPFIASITPTTNCSQNNFYVSTNQNCTLEVYDLSGRMLHTTKLHQGKQTFKLNELSNGVYICKLQSHQSVHTQRIVITNCN
jgi:hypothetical protein